MTGPGIGLLVALLKAVGRLALPADEQIAHLGDRRLLPSADEFALDLHEGAALVSQFVTHGWLTSRDAFGIVAVDEMLGRIRGADRVELWTADALEQAPEWEEVRRRAREVLDAQSAISWEDASSDSRRSARLTDSPASLLRRGRGAGHQVQISVQRASLMVRRSSSGH